MRADQLVRRICPPGPFVGWVERSETHQWRATKLMGFAALYPSYGLLPRPGNVRRGLQ
jgi:hypothetical protein